MKTLAEEMEAYDAERIREIEAWEKRQATPERVAERERRKQAKIEKEIRQGLRDENGEWVEVEESDDENEEENSDEEE